MNDKSNTTSILFKDIEIARKTIATCKDTVKTKTHEQAINENRSRSNSNSSLSSDCRSNSNSSHSSDCSDSSDSSDSLSTTSSTYYLLYIIVRYRHFPVYTSITRLMNLPIK